MDNYNTKSELKEIRTATLANAVAGNEVKPKREVNNKPFPLSLNKERGNK